MSNPVIAVEEVGKRYNLASQQPKGDGLRHSFESALRSPLRWLKSRSQKNKTEEFWALRDISFSVRQGEVVGLIGRNGAGKSTLLKLLSRITVPTTGRMRIRGRIASLLEVGTGFHPELTGRENIFMNGAILGMTRVEIRRKFDEIVAFSEIEKFLDTPVKRYSSGMYVRLAFAVAAHLEPEILIIDEVLAVGDAAFQRKCLGKMGSFAATGKTVLFVSHNMDAVRTLCSRGIWLNNGRVHQDGEAKRVIDSYHSSTPTAPVSSKAAVEYGFKIRKVALRNRDREEAREFAPGDDIMVEIDYEARRPIARPAFALAVGTHAGSCFSANMLLDGHAPALLEGEGRLTCIFRSVPLLPRDYLVRMVVRGTNPNDILFEFQEVANFTIEANLSEFGYRGDLMSWSVSTTPLVIPYEWHLQDGTRAAISLNRAVARA